MSVKQRALDLLLERRCSQIMSFRWLAFVLFVSIQSYSRGFVLSAAPTRSSWLSKNFRSGSYCTLKLVETTSPTSIAIEKEQESTAVAAVAVEDEEEDPSKQISISSEIILPFSAELAFDTFADLPRQPEWSPWLKSVEYTSSSSSSSTETLWKMKRFLGIVGYSWTASTTRLERPHHIHWKSTKGIRNFGRVQFVNGDTPNNTLMKLTMSVQVPRIVARILGGQSRVARYVQVALIRKTLIYFRDVVLRDQERLISAQP